MLLGLAGSARAEEPPPKQESAVPGAVTPDTMFEALTAMGDLKRAAGRLTSAAMNYQKALRIRRDPVIAGRLGVLLARLGLYEEAAEHLLDGFQRGRGASPAERESFKTHYNEVLAKGSWVKVVVSHAGARLMLDERRGVGGPTAFFVFMEPGEHTIHGNLEGFEDAEVTFTVEKGRDREVEVTFKPRPAPVVFDETSPAKAPLSDIAPAIVIQDPRYTRQEDPYAYAEEKLDEKEQGRGLHGFVGAGPVVVFGVASWNPAVGLVLTGGLRPHENVSIGIEGRAAWLTSGVADRNVAAMTAGGLLSACGHWRWLFVCALGHVGLLNVEFSSASYKPISYSNLLAGVGGRLGANLRMTRSLMLQGGVDAIGLSRGVQIVAQKTVLFEQPPVVIGAYIAGVWEL
ncbi:tetratricopeptide repeat protein [Polyangium sp. y55x31]|uniref:tetratricopeptide repeat protein n=1 Tax=Polyangium sp. y55x31 TaxID=3042688 RepID=UPI00248253CA|nr:tetratricopeptide repeat protein [Polyangium sp. y55x31]MDI1483578.1 tetratricopeptide repeat protein [Polyangium sp. y55x31]